jgi:hypothetical protein
MLADAVLQKPLRGVKWLRKVKLVLGLGWLVAILALLIAFKGFQSADFFYLTETIVSVDNVIIRVDSALLRECMEEREHITESIMHKIGGRQK